MRLRNLWVVAVLGLIPSSLYAQGVTINNVPIEAIGAGRAYIQPNGTVTQGIGFKATPPGATSPSYYQRAVTFTKGTVGGNAKQFAKFAAYSALFNGIVLGIGWSLDAITGDIYTTAPATYTCGGTSGVTCYNVYGGAVGGSYNDCQVNTAHCYSTQALAIAHVQQHHNSLTWQEGRVPFTCSLNGGTSPNWTIKCIGANGYNASLVNMNINTRSTTATQTVPGTQPTAEQIADNIVPKLSQELLDKLATHPETGAVKQTQEVLDAMTQLANELAKQADPNAPTVSAPTATTTANTTDAPPQAGTTLPPACIWFKPVCDFIEWFKPDPVPGSGDNPNWTVASMITEDELEVQSYSSGLGSGSCPADESFSVYGVSLNYSYTPMCDLAGTARIFVILGAYLLSIFIVLGIRR